MTRARCRSPPQVTGRSWGTSAAVGLALGAQHSEDIFLEKGTLSRWLILNPFHTCHWFSETLRDFGERRRLSREKREKSSGYFRPPTRKQPNVVPRDSPAVLQWLIFKLGFSLLTPGVCVKDAQRSESEGDERERERERGGRFRRTFPESVAAGVFQVYFCKPRCICCHRGSYTCKYSTSLPLARKLWHSYQQKSPKAS